MKTELERHKEALKSAVLDLDRFAKLGHDMPVIDINAWAARAIRDVELLLGPPPEMEEVEVTAWKHATFGDLTEEAETAAKWGAEAIELTGTYKRPKPQPVERSVRLTLYPDKGWATDGPESLSLGNYPRVGIFAWHEHP